MTTFYLDEMNGDNTKDGTSFANRWRTIGAGASVGNIAPGDTIRIMKSPDPASIGNGTWTNGSPKITLARSLTKTIDNCDYPWTASSNVTATVSTAAYKEGYGSASLAIASGFTTGLVAYKATGTLDLSSYQQVSFWFRASATVAQGVLALYLCSDTSGATPVNIIDIPAIPTINVWQNVTVNFLGNLGSSIQSICLYAISDPGTVTVLIDNIISCKSPPFTTIDNCDDAWTASANVTATANTTYYREGTGSASLAIASGFTTGLVAYKATGTLDLSSYQEVWLRIRTSLAISNVNYLNITLCSDTSGATPVNTFNIRALPTTNAWYTLQLVGGGNLGSSIKSVALNTTNDFGAATIYLDNIIAVKTNSFITIDNCDNVWTGSTNITSTVDTANKKEGTGSTSLAVTSGFTTGLVAYKATGELDLSSYQQVSFWIRSSSAISASSLTLTLCSDVAGATPVNTFAIPTITDINTWIEFSIDAGGNMGASIKSVAINALVDLGTVTILIDNIRTNDNVLTLSSLISKNTTDECWIGISSINDTIVFVDNTSAQLPSGIKGYVGLSETTTTYKRECLKPSTLPTTGTWEAINDSGTDGSPIVFSGGWDMTNMSTQDGDTFIDGQNFTANAIVCGGKSYITFEKINLVRFANGYLITGSFLTFNSNLYLSNNLTNNFSSTSPSMTINNIYSYGAGSDGITIAAPNISFQTLVSNSNIGSGLYLNASANSRVEKNGIISNNGTYGIRLANVCNSIFYHISLCNNTTYGIYNNSATNNFFVDPELDNAIDIYSIPYANSSTYVQQSDKINNYHQIYTDGAIISSKTGSERHTESGLGWEVAAINATRTINNPVLFKIATLACNANEQRTVTAYIKRNTKNVVSQLFIPRNQISGITTDLYTTATGNLYEYKQETINFTPTEIGVVDVYLKCYGLTPFIVYVDDIVGS